MNILSAEQLGVPSNLESAAATITQYAQLNRLSPQQVIDIFEAGIFAFTKAGVLPAAADCMVIREVRAPLGEEGAGAGPLALSGVGLGQLEVRRFEAGEVLDLSRPQTLSPVPQS